MIAPRLFCVLVACASAAPAVTRSVALEHSFGGEYAARGSVELTAGATKAKMAKVKGEVVLDGADGEAFQALILNGGFYRVRARADGEGARWVVAAVRACELQRAAFAEELALQLDASGNVVGLSFGGLQRTPKACSEAKALPLTFATTATAALDAVAQVIPVQTAVAKPPPGVGHAIRALGGERPEGDDSIPEDEKPNKSFLMRYWHIIVPVALLLLTSKDAPPDDKAATKAQKKEAVKAA
ncbi:hypothetical protein M885DRAFT_517312 [Pelagophyceae sp. CCMP2097]|nr:hypothetical protein M885DRAFT_517312 [Pelagophyceae sp. CCMP2097]